MTCDALVWVIFPPSPTVRVPLTVGSVKVNPEIFVIVVPDEISVEPIVGAE